ncbi:MAG: PAS domain S-box protein [Symploca sp. SIO2E6]|nr:PAS domain S-box protein [Symploca sp. SIO2E6]
MNDYHSPETILIVDDSEENLHLLTKLLLEHKYEVRPALDGQSAIVAALAEPPDLILLDILMPGINGYQVCEQLKADERTKEIPIVFLTALQEVCDKVKGFSLGAIDYITKPFQTQEVIARVEAQLANQRLKKQLEEQNRRLQQEIAFRTAAEKQLRLLERAIAASSNGIVITDAQLPDNPVVYVNSGFENLTGYTAEEVMGKNCRFLQGMELEQTGRGQLRQAITEKQECQTVLRNFRKDGTPFWQELTISPVYDPQGNLTNFIGVQQDITNRIAAEEALKKSEERWQLVIRSTGDGIFDWNIQTGEVFMSAELKQMQGFAEDELANTYEAWRNLLHPEDLDETLVALATHLKRQTPLYEVEYRLRCKDGSYKWILARGEAQWDQRGNPIRMVGSHKDISARKQAEQALQLSEAQQREKAKQLELALAELKRTQAKLIQSAKMSSLGEMIAGIAHEINNPTSFISGNLEFARQYFQDLIHLVELYQQAYPNPTPKIQDYTQKIDLDFLTQDWQKLTNSMQIGAKRISEIVRSLKIFSRQNESKLELLDIHESIDDTLLILEHRLKPTDKTKGIEVLKNYEQLPKVNCYASQLNQVFMNILANAIDALQTQTPPRVITISTYVTKQFKLQNLPNHSPAAVSASVALVSSLSLSQDSISQGYSYTDIMPNAQTQDNLGIQESSSSNLKEQQLHLKPPYQDTEFVVIQIADNGPGMSKELQQKIFDPFFTTKQVGSGTGLGLSISYQIIVENHNGQLSCISTPGQGTEFIIKIPV